MANQVPLLQTKLYPPRGRVAVVQRARLRELMGTASLHSLTLVSAPAGYGKSTLVADWLDSRPEPSSWLSLDAEDNNLVVFLSYLVAAVRVTFPQACSQTLALLDAAEPPPMAMIASYLSNELNAIDTPFILVLDDYHHIHEPAVHELLSRFLQHPPQPLHLVLVARRDPPLPLAVLRARGQLTDVRLEDLRFTAAETRDFLQSVAKIAVSDRALATVQACLEGWAAGLQLLVLALHRQADWADLDDVDDFLSKLSGSVLPLQDYLVEEVLSRLPPEIQTVLMQTAILDRFCPQLCEAVQVPAESAGLLSFDGQGFIEFLQHQNLFTISLDGHGGWFRYHHLFQELLQQRLARHSDPGAIADLHQRASAWFEAHNLLDDAIRHALAAEDVERAAQLVEQHRHAELNMDRWYVVQRWLAILPTEIKQKRPALLLAQAWVAYFRYRLHEIPSLLKRIQAVLIDQAAEPAVLEELNLLWGIVWFWQGHGERSGKCLVEALKQTPETYRLIRAEADLYVGLAHYISGQKETAILALNDKIESSDVSESLGVSRRIGGLLFIYFISGELVQATEMAQRIEDLAKGSSDVYAEAWSRYLQASVHLHSYDLDAALSHFRFVVEHRYRLHTRAAVNALAGLALTYQAMHQPDGVTKTLTQLLEFARETNDSQNLRLAQSCQARLSLLQGDLQAALHWAQPFHETSTLPSMFLWLEVPAITQARVLVAVGSPDSLQQATDLLQALRQQTETWHLTCQTIEILVLQSVALEKQGHAEEALTVLEQAVALAGPQGWIRPFVELGRPMVDLLRRLTQQNVAENSIGRILTACEQDEPRAVILHPPQAPTAAASPLIEPLTNREDEILALLAQRLQDKEIAAELFVSTETVKSHLKHLYQKLDVRTRRQAVIKARDLGLLSAQ